MRLQRWVRWATVAAGGSMVLFQFNGCNWNDFWVRAAGVGAIASGAINLFGT